MAVHPFTPLSAAEISAASKIIRAAHPENARFRFKGITLLEPPKEEMKKWAEQVKNGGSPFPPRRKAWVNYYLENTDYFHEAVVDLTGQRLESNLRLAKHFHGPADDKEVILAEKVCLEDPRVQAEIEKLQLPPGSVVVSDPWIWGSDGVDDARRQFQCYMYVRDPANSSQPDSNHYAFPLSFSPVVDTVTMKVTKIDYMPTGKDFTTHPTQPYKPVPANEYIPELNNLRKDLKELQVLQPNGASFTVKGDVITWQKWEFLLGFNYREGMVLYDVSYDGRPLFYRVALSDMSIPYADPRPPFHKKQAFDLGDTGAGMMANDLKLGCDCLGAIYYKDGVIADEEGNPLLKPNAVCIHEQDNGIGWKHTNYRTGRAAVVRNRELVLQSIITVSNYEYILAFQFNQAGEFHYEVRATGILSTQAIDQGITVPWGTVVHPGVLAVHHQHIFSLRLDPALDGSHANRLVYSEAHAEPRHPLRNPHGNAYSTRETVVDTSTGLDLDSARNRVFKIQNPQSRNPVNGEPVAYKIMVPPFQPILADKESFHYRRAEFADRALYVTKYRDGELFAGGLYTNQSRGGHGVRGWAERRDNVKDEDIVVWINFGINHIPRIEDFPVMHVEIIKVSLKPVNFFDRNPAIDVPPSTQSFNRSTLLSDQGSCCKTADPSKL